MNLSDLTRKLLILLWGKNVSIITKAQTNLGLEGDNVKNIISPNDGGYILIKWS